MSDKVCIGYILTRDCGTGSLFCGTSPEEVAHTIYNEIEANEGLSIEEMDSMTITPVEITQEAIDNMGEFQGW